MALKLVNPGDGVFHVRGGELLPANACTWNTWKTGRIYPPAGTYWVQTTDGTQISKRNTSTGAQETKVQSQTVITVTDGDYLLLQWMKDGQAVRVTPV